MRSKTSRAAVEDDTEEREDADTDLDRDLGESGGVAARPGDAGGGERAGAEICVGAFVEAAVAVVVVVAVAVAVAVASDGGLMMAGGLSLDDDDEDARCEARFRVGAVVTVSLAGWPCV